MMFNWPWWITIPVDVFYSVPWWAWIVLGLGAAALLGEWLS